MLRQFDVVTLIRIPTLNAGEFLKTNRHLPRAGDVATILDIFTHPCLGYGLECCESGDPHAEWMHTFTEDELRHCLGPSAMGPA